MPELERFRIPADDMKCFLIACRSAYNSFVIYHNFRHVIDVLQATFVFLLQLRVLPAYPYNSEEQNPEPAAKSPIANILKPFDALTLLVSAIGHDVGHPGVNNAFLVALKSPLAQLYNDLSVLEAFHCAAYSQILRRYWNSAFEDTAMRGLLIKSILATDMGVHFKYMSDLGNLQEKVHHYHDTDSWNENVFEEYRVLICGLLIKCADISNVARPFKTAEKWADTLQLEFARQGEMEKDVGIPTTLFGGPPELGNLMKLANSQIGFMNIFARPLFGAVADILPGMEFAVNEIKSNTKIWEAKVSQEKARLEENLLQAQTKDEGTRSPRSGSPDRFQSRSLPELSHPEGLPASGSEPSVPDTMPMSSSMPLPDLEPRPASHESSTHKAHDRKASSNNSRRSSGVVSLGSISPQRGLLGMERRRSSNTLPSQLQLSFANHIQDKETGEGTGSSENSVPSRSRKVSVETIPASNTNETSRKGSWSEPSLGGSPVTSTADRAVDETSFRSHKLPHSRQQHFSRPLSYRHSAHPSSTRHSTISGSQDRNSKSTSGAFTMSSHAVPYSPTDTRATSFFTEGSEKASSIMLTDDEHDTTYTKNGSVASLQNSSAEPEKRIRPKSYLEPPGVNGHVSQDSVASSAPERTVRKKTSRFRFVEFWKGKKKGVE
ncbi:3',5'-cyclic-nucleotide phosphodiesterase [Agyrium rufum]|nr:3',5'-cyclic-nucleotide phosphodiesterase [Agyrium rufum]